MTRIAFSQLSRNAVNDVFRNYADVLKYSNQLSSGYKAVNPGDTDRAGQISQAHNTLSRIESYTNRTSSAEALLRFQDDTIDSALEMVARAQDLATQASNEAVDGNQRGTIAIELFQIRNQLVTLANSKYQGNYVWSGTNIDVAPFSAASYANAGSTDSAQRFIYQGNSGATGTNSVQVSDGVAIQTNTSGSQVWGSLIEAVEVLARASEGFPTGVGGAAPGTGPTQYTFPGDYPAQTQAIGSALGALRSARDAGLLAERTSIGARLNRIETATAALQATKTAAQATLDSFQNADIATAATGLQQAQYGLQASMKVTSQVLNLNILDYL